MNFEDDDTINRVNCYCHLLHNIIGQMCAVDPVKNIIEKTSSLVSYIKNAGLGEKCNPKLKKYIDVRWNTVYYTLNSVAINYSKISEILFEKEKADSTVNVMHKLTDISRADLDPICEFLNSFTVWIERLEADEKPTLWMVWIAFWWLKKYLVDKNDDSDNVKEMKAAGRIYLQKKIEDYTPTMIHKIATVLHPQLKNIALATEAERTNVYGVIDDYIWKNEPFHQTVDTSLNEERDKIGNNDILEAFMGTADNTPPPSDYTKELDTYLQINVAKSDVYDFDLCGWWHQNRNSFPKLFRLFKSKAGITASSAPSERKFSETGIIITARRANLLPETVSDLVLARNSLMNFL